MKILVINGPNMNMLGIREPGMYGSAGYDELVEYIKKEKGSGNEIDFVQSNHEGTIVDEVQRAYFEGYDGIVMNPAAYTHTSIAIMDALKAVPVPCVEVHITDPSAREDYRRKSFVSEAAVATFAGKGFRGYVEAIDILERLGGQKA